MILVKQSSERTSGGVSPVAVLWRWVVALSVLGACPVSAQFSFVTNNNELTITGYAGPGGEVALPDNSAGLPVTAVASQACWFNGNIASLIITNPSLALGDRAFYRCSLLTNVVLGAGVTNIGLSAFGFDTSLLSLSVDPANPFYSSRDGVLFDKNQTTLLQCPGGRSGSYTVPATVTAIASNACAYCTALTSVVLPDGVTNIQDSAFSNCSMTNIVLGTNLASIGGSAFFQSGLLNITLPASVTNIGSTPFILCHNLSAINVDPANPAYSSADGVLLDQAQHNLLACPPGKVSSFNLPLTVTNVAPYAFESAGLPNLVVPSGLVTISDYGFYGGGPRKLELPDTLTSIGRYSLSGPLTNVTFGTGLTNIGDYAMSQCAYLWQVRFRGNAPTLGGTHVFSGSGAGSGRPPTVYYVPGTTGWGPTFAGSPTVAWDPVSLCTFSNLNNTLFVTGYLGSSNSVSVPANVGGIPVVAIADYAFDQNTRLTNFALPASVTSIGSHAFDGCRALGAINLAAVTNIGTAAFSGCASLSAVSFSPRLASLGAGAFAGCFSLQSSLVIPAAVPLLYATFEGCTNLTSIYFLGDAPMATVPFLSDNKLTLYYLPDTLGWSNSLAGRPSVLWNPHATQAALRLDGFSFTIAGSSNLTLVVEASTNLVTGSWAPVATNTLSGGSAPFTDPAATNYPTRYYRFRSP